MRATINTARIIVGVLFVVSGLVKANDPLGLAYKMQEFFEIWNADLTTSSFFLKTAFINFFSYLHNHALGLSIFMITLEILAGIALLIGWQRKAVLNLLLVLIVFFTFLTAYAFLSGKFKNCGCFGDCIPISPLASFIKDVLLLALIVFLIIGQRHITPLLNKRVQWATLGTSLALVLGFQWYVLNYLPLEDCLPFKKGNNIAEQMKIPPNAITDSFAMKFVYERGGKQYEFGMDELPADLQNYKFIDRIQKLVRKGNAEPPIKGFSLIAASGTDSTEAVLNEPAALLLISEYFRVADAPWITDFKQMLNRAKQKNVPIYIVTPDAAAARSFFAQSGMGHIPVFNCDNTAVRTVARTSPTILLLNKGNIIQKYSYRQIDKLTGQL